jgi:hypothetical protein
MCKGSIKGTVALVTGGNGDFVVPFWLYVKPKIQRLEADQWSLSKLNALDSFIRFRCVLLLWGLAIGFFLLKIYRIIHQMEIRQAIGRTSLHAKYESPSTWRSFAFGCIQGVDLIFVSGVFVKASEVFLAVQSPRCSFPVDSIDSVEAVLGGAWRCDSPLGVACASEHVGKPTLCSTSRSSLHLD